MIIVCSLFVLVIFKLVFCVFCVISDVGILFEVFMLGDWNNGMDVISLVLE